MVLSGLNHVFVGVETHHRKQAIDLATYFIASLAEHAGIVLGSHLRQMVRTELGGRGQACRMPGQGASSASSHSPPSPLAC